MSSTWITAHTDTSDHGLSQISWSRGGCEWFDRHQKNRWWSISLLPVGAAYTRGFKCAHSKNLKNWGQQVVDLYFENYLQIYSKVIWTAFLVLVWGIHSWCFSNQFRYILYVYRYVYMYTILLVRSLVCLLFSVAVYIVLFELNMLILLINVWGSETSFDTITISISTLLSFRKSCSSFFRLACFLIFHRNVLPLSYLLYWQMWYRVRCLVLLLTFLRLC